MVLSDAQKAAIRRVERCIMYADEAIGEAAALFPESVRLLWRQCSIEVTNGTFWIDKVVERMEEEAEKWTEEK